MGLDGLDSYEGDEWWGEKWHEKAPEKAREQGKSLAGIGRTRKDEKKAQRDNDYLHLCLREIIISKRYDGIIPFIFPLFDTGIPSHIIIGAFSLIHDPASDIIRDHYTTEGGNKTHRTFDFRAYETPVEFDDETLEPVIRKRINEWIEDIFTVIGHDPSSVMTGRFLRILSSREKNDLIRLFREILIFFLRALNIHISETRSGLYSEFILQEVEKKLKKIPLEEI